ncbi:phosphotransferase family protein [Natronoarchaeum sp. GCM10025321]|uniref:phosphotransferase family protein n=1 Tax=Natronoarchaeum sp. GCM10025321 TaxID=3252684 RepID=UPI003609B455
MNDVYERTTRGGWFDVSEEYLDRLVDEGSLSDYLTDELGSAEEFTVTRHDQGHSNETLFVEWGDREFVLRRPPAGETAETAHEVTREYLVMDALQETPVPVPTTVLACEDESVLGAEFYLMERQHGDVLRTDEPERFQSETARERLSEEVIDTLAAIHSVDPAAVGLDDFGYPEGFTERQVRRWSEQFTWAFDVTGEEREVPEVYELMSWLTEHAPEGHPHMLVHGDFKLDNLMFAPGTPPDLTAVFDWELSTLGDPHTDLGLLLLFWQEPDDPDPPIPELMPTFTAKPGYLSREELIERYERESGIEAENLRFYRVLAAYKMAALGEMFFRRHLEGNAADSLYPKMRDGVPRLAKRTLEMAKGSGDVSL